MALTNGTYDIMNHGRIPRCAGAPPGSVALGTPVMAVSPPLMLPIEVKRMGDDTSYLFTATINTLLAPFQPEADFPHKGVQHTSEIAFIFRALSQSSLPIPESYLRLEDSTFNYWLNFAYTLNPSPTPGSCTCSCS
ncbi:hypothetical protein RSOLAG1IB_09796 [Rhizoctonia solani AG-1 IB]|uniref:Uncharacterized protein n=1 Tax=Thanatephorus cucumeris (strain AG1-IB / isolate 7/3/14) TaxID=1108050 RepID=A0A0B7FWB7_THACB|nr:hypothetical protein RSOLAG1IB_09796 [Rhizoctonia solani AG-1 IB]